MNADELDAAAIALHGPWGDDSPAYAMTTAAEMLQQTAQERRTLERVEISLDGKGRLRLLCRICGRYRDGISPGITAATLLRNAHGICGNGARSADH